MHKFESEVTNDFNYLRQEDSIDLPVRQRQTPMVPEDSGCGGMPYFD